MSTFFFYVCTAFTKDIQWIEKEVYLKEVGWCWGGSERWFMYHAYSNLFALGTTQPWGNLYDEESNKYLSKLGGQIGAQLQLVDGGGEQRGMGGGSHNVCCIPKNNLPQLSHVSRQEGIKSGLFLSLSLPL